MIPGGKFYIRRKRYFIFLISFILILSACASEQRADGVITEIKEGNIHLVLNESSANFSLYYLTDTEAARYTPLFNAKDNLASFTSISVNNKVYKLSDKFFRRSVQMIDGYPAYRFESASLSVTQAFTPVTTFNSLEVNGILITFTIHNTASTDQSVGLRMLLDTELGEGWGNTPFVLNTGDITNETLIDADAGAKFWISGNGNVSLMGSVVNPLDSAAKNPDSVRFANWRRFFSNKWTFNYSAGRSFNSDSAVCYFYEPSFISSGGIFTYTIFLTAPDIDWYLAERNAANPAPAAVTTAENTIADISVRTADTSPAAEQPQVTQTAAVNEHTDIVILQMLQDLLRQFINGEIDLSEQDLIEIEDAIKRHR